MKEILVGLPIVLGAAFLIGGWVVGWCHLALYLGNKMDWNDGQSILLAVAGATSPGSIPLMYQLGSKILGT